LGEQILWYSNGVRKVKGKCYVVENKERFIKVFNKEKKSDISEMEKEIKRLQNKIRKLKILDGEAIANEIDWDIKED